MSNQIVELQQLPGIANITCFYNDDYILQLDYDLSLVGYTLSAGIKDMNDNIITSFTINPYDLPNGIIILTLTKTQIDLIPANSTWFLSWIDTSNYNRTAMSGTFKVIKKA